MELTAKLSPETTKIIDDGQSIDAHIIPQFISMLRQELIFFESESNSMKREIELLQESLMTYRKRIDELEDKRNHCSWCRDQDDLFGTMTDSYICKF